MLDWIVDILRSIFFFIDNIIYTFIVTLYNLLVDIAETSIFTEEVIDLFASKVYALLGIFMLFKVSFSIISYIVNPDEFLDKTKGFGKLIGNIIITLVLLIATPWIFSQAMDIQRIVLRDNILGKIFSTSEVNTQIVTDPGNTMAYETYKAFYHLNYDSHPECEGIETALTEPNSNYNRDNCMQNAFANEDNFTAYEETLQYAYATNSISIYMNSNMVNLRDSNDNYTMSYIPFISTLAGGAIALLLIVFCFDVAVRSVKLGFMRMIAPIPIVSRIDPKKGKDTFDKWLKVCISTYLDLFIRLLAIYFAVFVITQLVDLQFVDAVTGVRSDVNAFVKVFIILGALLFAKQLPKLLEDLTGMKLGGGKFTLNPMKKLGEVPLASAAVGAAGAAVGGAAANLYAGIRNGNGVGGTIRSTIGGATGGLFRGAKAGLTGKEKDNVLKSVNTGLKGTVDARNLRDSRKLAGDSGLPGAARRFGASINEMAGVQSGASKFDRQISAYDSFLKEHSALDEYVAGEIEKGKLSGDTNFTWKDVNGNTYSSKGNVTLLKQAAESLKSDPNASPLARRNADLMYAAALDKAKQDYITNNMATDAAISNMVSNMNYIKETNSSYDGFSGMGNITDGSSWDSAKKAIKKAKSNTVSSPEYRQAQVNKKNDAKK